MAACQRRTSQFFEDFGRFFAEKVEFQTRPLRHIIRTRILRRFVGIYPLIRPALSNAAFRFPVADQRARGPQRTRPTAAASAGVCQYGCQQLGGMSAVSDWCLECRPGSGREQDPGQAGPKQLFLRSEGACIGHMEPVAGQRISASLTTARAPHTARVPDGGCRAVTRSSRSTWLIATWQVVRLCAPGDRHHQDHRRCASRPCVGPLPPAGHARSTPRGNAVKPAHGEKDRFASAARP